MTLDDDRRAQNEDMRVRSLGWVFLSLAGACGPLKSYEGLDSGGSGRIEEKLPTTIGTIPPDPGTSLASSGKYLTTSGGSFSMAKVMSMGLASNRLIRGFDSDGENLYVLIRTDQGGGIIRWSLLRTELNGGTWIEQCSFLDDGAYGGGLALTEAGFVTLGTSCGNCSPWGHWVRKLTSSCGSAGTVFLPGRTARTSYSSGSANGNLSYLGSNKYGFEEQYRGYYIFDASTLAYEPELKGASLAGQSVSFEGYSVVQFRSEGGWAIGSKLWKLNRNGQPLAWGALPTQTYPLIGQNVEYVSRVGANHLAVLTLSTGQFHVFVLDVRNF